MDETCANNTKKSKTTCKHVFSANKLPNLKKGTTADQRRINAVAFGQELSKKNGNVDLEEELKSERDGMFLEMVRRVLKLLSLSALPEGGVASKACMARMGD
jgi:phage/plasmid-associated DNA primase